MRHLLYPKHLAIMIIAIFIYATSAQAAVEVNGLWYKTATSGATVVTKADGSKYSGDITVPDEVTIDGSSYPVISVDTVFQNSPELTSLILGANCTTCKTIQNCTALKVFKWNLTADKTSSNINYTQQGRGSVINFIKNCPALECVIYPLNVSGSIPEGQFSGNTNLSEVRLPQNITTIESKTFYNCTALKTINLDYANTIKESAFYFCSSLENINMPNVTDIGDYSFYGCDKLSELKFHEGLVSVGNYAFSSLTRLHIPSTLVTLGNGNVLSCNLTSITVSEGSQYFMAKNNALYSIDGETLFAIAGKNYAGPSVFEDNAVKTIKQNAFSLIPITGFIMPALKTVEQSAFSSTSIEKVTLKSDVNYELYAFGFCDNLTEIIIEDGANLKRGIFMGCKNVSYIECPFIYPPEHQNGPSLTKATLVVPKNSVESYKAHPYWGTAKEITYNSDWDKPSEASQLPNGLYFAVKGGNICYYQDGQIHDTGINSGAHPFNMQIHKNAIYIADAGEQHIYTTEENGDGQLFKVELFGDKYKKTRLVYPSTPFSDPYTCWIDSETSTLYSGDRNSKIYRLNLNDTSWLGLSTNALPTLVNGWDKLPYYGRGIAYGAFPRGFQKDKNGVYWLAVSYGGYGVFSFTDKDIYATNAEASVASLPDANPDLTDVRRLTAIYIDTTNDYLYFAGADVVDYGIYRIPLSVLREKGARLSDCELIDNSPADSENSTSEEGVHIRQITGDEKYIYWSYIADATSGNNSGIKRVNISGTPKVEYVLENVKAYGLTAYNCDYTGIETVKTDGDIITVACNTITAIANSIITIYNTGGGILLSTELCAGQSLSLDLNCGVYIINASGMNKVQTEKVVIR